MIEFGLQHHGRSGWKKKYPRKEINKGDFKHQSMHDRFKFGYDRNYHNGWLSWKDLNKFFEANLGKNVDKVFSEYVKRAKRFDHDVSLRERFFDELKPDRRWRNNYTIDSQKRIVRVKKEKSKGISAHEAIKYNKAHIPTSFKPYMKENELTYVGHFYVRERNWYGNWHLIPVFITNKDWYDTVLSIGFGKEYVKYSNMTKIAIELSKYKEWNYSDRAYGVPKRGFTTIYEKTGHSVELPNGLLWDIERPVHIPYTFRMDEADFIFLVKGLNWKEY